MYLCMYICIHIYTQQTRNTDVKRATVHPEFNQTLEFLVRGAKNVHEEILIAEIWSVGTCLCVGGRGGPYFFTYVLFLKQEGIWK